LIKKKGQQKVRMIFWERRRCEEGQKGTFSNQLFEGRKKKEIKKEEDFWISLSLSLSLSNWWTFSPPSIVGSAPRSRGISVGITHLFPLVAHFLSAASWWWCGDAHTNFVFVFSPQRCVRFCLFLRKKRDKN